jgi:guanylate kinase
MGKKGYNHSPILFVVSAPSGTGKTSVLKEVIARTEKIRFSVSHTTRPPRLNEIEGVDYYFVTKEEFQKKIEKGEFLEWANVYGNFYGTSKEEILRSEKEGVDLILELDVQGAKTIREKIPSSVGIFIFPPSFSELENRLRKRGTNTEEEIEKRLKIAHEEIQWAVHYPYWVVNENFQKTVETIRGIILAERSRRERWKTFPCS